MDYQNCNCHINISDVKASTFESVYHKNFLIYACLVISFKKKQILYIGQRLKNGIYQNKENQPEISTIPFSINSGDSRNMLAFWAEPFDSNSFFASITIEFCARTILKGSAMVYVMEKDQEGKPDLCSILFTRNCENQLQIPIKAKVEITKRELEVLKLVAKGQSAKQVAADLNISVHTAISHKKNLIEKFKVKNTPELIMEASSQFFI